MEEEGRASTDWQNYVTKNGLVFSYIVSVRGESRTVEGWLLVSVGTHLFSIINTGNTKHHCKSVSC